jgi:hypothetical protein
LVSFPPVCSATSSLLPAAIGACLEDAYSNAGGGGERVLWTAIALMQRTEPDVISVVYSGDTDASKEQIVAKAKVRTRVSPAAAMPPYHLSLPPLCARRPGSISRWTRARFILSSSSRGGSSRTARGRGSHSSGRAWAPCTSRGRRCPSSSQISISVRRLAPFLCLRDCLASVWRRYDGICLYVSCRRVACWHPRWRICALSHH